ncbi:restriction endonuclease subunit S [Bradyrhizobium amphicarpaeae]|uniref:Restriction endonuclease subunit S n=1 Tax=Bradyrhizobium amphicarpaeae TaxID=1404768 RepID=A0A2U8PLM1_9BRAD|nr:restriction endonuclease subunit S [Bradyrhizobium amphicarpaeae]AWL98623.1 restriction endonuclease subunit S [Bradyrhizobium amphicarpaeae]
MIDGLRPYPEMKPSGLAWLGDVPAHWDVLRSKYAFREVDCRSMTGEETHLSMSQRLGLVPASLVEKSLVSESYIGAKLVEKDDLVLNRLKAHLGVFAYAKLPGLISPDYTVLRPKPRASVRFFEYVLKSSACRVELRIRAKGIVEGFWRLYTDDFYDIRLPMPPLDEQRLIVRFLDWHGAQTAKLIRAKKKISALLNEQKQAIIHRAVTRGLDPNVNLKQSGVPYLGGVPAGWRLTRLKHVCRINPSKMAIKSRAPEDLATFLPMERVSSDGKIDSSLQSPISELANGFTYFERNDVILAKITPCFENGKGAVLDRLPTEVGFGSTEFIVLRATSAIYPRFLYLLTFEAQFRRLGVESMTGSAGQQRISPDFVANYFVALPERDEQVRIVDSLQSAIREFDAAIDAAHTEVALIQEFRTRLISDVVTGKLDVRTFAASLPETTEAEPISDVAEGDDLEEAAEDTESEEAAA